MKFIIQDETRRNNAMEFIKQADIGKPLEVFIKPYKKKRSLSQNNTMWMWYEPLGEHIGETPEDLHEILKTRFLGVDEVVIDGIQMRTPKSTTGLSLSEMADYLTRVEMLARNLEVVLMYPDDYNFAMRG